MSNVKIKSNSSIKILNIGGEKLHKNIYSRIKTKFGSYTKIFMQYGTTETTIVSSYLKIDGKKKVNLIGKSIRNERFYVLNTNINSITSFESRRTSFSFFISSKIHILILKILYT